MAQRSSASAPRRRHRSWRRPLGSLAALLTVSLLIAFLPAFRLSRYEISPTRAIATDAIAAAVPQKPGQHLFSGLGPDLPHWLGLRYGRTEMLLKEKFPYIRTVRASLDFPSQMKIEIEERVEVAYVAIPDGCVLLDREGYALTILDQPPAGIPVIEGVTAASLALGQPLTVHSPETMNRAVSLLSAIIDADKDTRTSQKLLSQVRQIRPLANGRLFLTLVLPATGDELTVAVDRGDSLPDDMLWLRFAMDQGALDNRGKGVLDLSGTRRTFIPDT
jgi:cell division septal protein FtsQ